MATSAPNRHIGVMGGSFNPVHYGHLKVASDAKRRLALDAMCIMPAAQSPLKTQHSVSAQHRLAMLDLALTEFPELQLDTRELERGRDRLTRWTVLRNCAERWAAMQRSIS